MGSAVTGPGSLNPLSLLNALYAPAQSTAPSAATGGVTAQQEFTAMQNSGDLNGLLSDSVAIGVMQIADSSTAPSGAGVDMSNLVNQLIAAYAPAGEPGSASATPQTAASLSTNPALAIIQTVEGNSGLAMGQAAGS
jgi:hypothetical protein